MPNWFYFDKNEKKGPFTSEELFARAESGEIRWGTIVETTDGRQTLAKNVKGLFPTQESATKPFVVAPPVAVPPVSGAENLAVLPAVPLDRELFIAEEPLLQVTSPLLPNRNVQPLLSRKIVSCSCCVICLLLFLCGIYFAWKGAQERITAEEKITRYSSSSQVNAYVGGDAYNYIINGTYFTAYSVRSLQRTIQSAVCFLLAGMFGLTALFIVFLPMPAAEIRPSP